MNKNILKGTIIVLFIMIIGLGLCSILIKNKDKKENIISNSNNNIKEEKVELSSEFYNYDYDAFSSVYEGTTMWNYDNINIMEAVWPGYDPEYRTIEQFEKDQKRAVELKADFINKLMKEKKSFLVVVESESVCTVHAPDSTDLVVNATEFGREHNIYRFYMGTDVFFKTDLHKTVKYVPTVIIVKDGEVYKYTDPNSDEFIDFNKSYEKVKEWLEKYIVIK